jgi:hypothetical protein
MKKSQSAALAQNSRPRAMASMEPLGTIYAIIIGPPSSQFLPHSDDIIKKYLDSNRW